MRLRKDLIHAWIGWRDDQKQKDCPGCARMHGILPCTTADGFTEGGEQVRSRGYGCRHCGLEFTLHFHFVDLTLQWQAFRWIKGVALWRSEGGDDGGQ